jgi:hypothetical protein
MIIGVDWLEDHNPMWAYWKKKVMKLPHSGKRIQLQLQGIKPDLTMCVRVSTHKLKGLLKKKVVTHCVHLNLVPTSSAGDSYYV